MQDKEFWKSKQTLLLQLVLYNSHNNVRTMKFPANKILRRHLKTGEKKQNLATLRERLRKRSQQIGRLSKKSLRKQVAWIRRFKWSCLTAFFLISLGLIFFPDSLENQLSGMVRVELACTNRIISQSGDTLYSNELSTKVVDESLSLADSINQAKLSGSGFFVSNGGHVVTAITAPASMTTKKTDYALRQELREDSIALEILSKQLKRSHREFDYYARTHSVVDDGYNDVMALREKVILRQANADSMLSRVKRMLHSKPKSLSCKLLQSYTVSVVSPSDSGKVVIRRYKAALCRNNGDSLSLLQIAGNSLPKNTRHFSPWYFNPQNCMPLAQPEIELGFQHTRENAETLSDVAQTKPHHKYFSNTSIVVNRWGQLVGVNYGNNYADFSSLHKLFYAHHSYIGWFAYNVVKWFRSLFDNHHYFQEVSLKIPTASPRNILGWNTVGNQYQEVVLGKQHYSGRYLHQQPNGEGTMIYGDSCTYQGEWKNGLREGFGTLYIPQRGTWQGYWHADTLQSGTFNNLTQEYTGKFNRHLEFEGEGKLRTFKSPQISNHPIPYAIDSTYYAGLWKAGKRANFGIAIEPKKTIHAGIWKNDHFLGEQMIYTSHRVYGIDISRFQHDIKKKTYGIDWSDLRITSLGSLKRRIHGNASYPVSFVYIKATEGKKLRNKYFHTDAQHARQHGIAVGAYHFFSTHIPAAEQAAWFLKYAAPHQGDLPPMLDVEPTEKQIQDMGGEDVLFRAMLSWLRIVERHTGTRPLIYVGQMFVNRHLRKAPQELQDYDIWIARYSEFKPFVQLQYWQLTSEGRVKGIHGDVDINVFNGTKENFQKHRTLNGVKHSK